MLWLHRTIQLQPFARGIHPISRTIFEALPEIEHVSVGTLNLFLQHTSASLTINENADPDVLVDLDRVLSDVAPEGFPYRHQEEGADDMPAHVKASLFGASLTIPVFNGRLCLGTWQGICLCEHRHHGGRRRLVLTLMGDAKDEAETRK